VLMRLAKPTAFVRSDLMRRGWPWGPDWPELVWISHQQQLGLLPAGASSRSAVAWSDSSIDTSSTTTRSKAKGAGDGGRRVPPGSQQAMQGVWCRKAASWPAKQSSGKEAEGCSSIAV